MKRNLAEKTKYITTILAQHPKREGQVCGDCVTIERTPEATTAILADGIGTGIKARVAAVMCSSRLMELLRVGFTLREACQKLVETMHEARTTDIPFAAFTVCRVLNNGQATIIAYESPSPILVSKTLAAYLPEQRFFPMGLEMIAETTCMLDYGDGIVLVSDGVSQAGLGHQYRMGWQVQGARDFINGCFVQREPLRTIPERVLGKVKEISGFDYGDDTTCLLLLCRRARTLNILTGPPAEKSWDADVVRQFMEAEGAKAVCGSTTAELVGRELNLPVSINYISDSFHKPPSYAIEGIDLVTEGAITLNQVCNILDELPEVLDKSSSVSDLYRLFYTSDTINFIVGTAANPGHQNIVFKQMGVLPRQVIVQHLAEKLKKLGKLVNLEYV